MSLSASTSLPDEAAVRPGEQPGRTHAVPVVSCDDEQMVLVLAEGLELDEQLFELRRDGVAVPLEPQAFDVLVHLVHHRDRVVSKEELLDAVWGQRFVSEAAITSRIKQVRRALGDDGHAQRMIRTSHGRGYRYVGPASETADKTGTQPVLAKSPVERPPIRYTESDGLNIAYQVTGGGDIDIVLISGFVSHLDLDWDDERHARFLDGLGSLGRLIRFDKRGTGMSDRPVGVPDLETRMHDVLAVMDAVGSARAVLCGYSEGVPMALLLAATHPERVAGLVLYGGYARRTWAPDYPWARTEEERAAYTERLVTTWDWEADLRVRCPSGDRAMERWWSRRMRAAATPATVRALLDMNSLVDVRRVLPTIATPTLVLHRTGDVMFDPQEAHYLADRVPGATLRLLEGTDHLPFWNPDQVLAEIAPFVAALPATEDHRALAAVVSVDGDGAHPARAALASAGGRPRPVRGAPPPAKVVLFDGPATGVRTALEVLAEHADVGIGLAIDEVVLDGPVSGPGVDTAVGLAGAAEPGSILVSHTAGVLLSGSGIRLETAGPDAYRVAEPPRPRPGTRPGDGQDEGAAHQQRGV